MYYGILAACIAGMAMFLGLFAVSVESDTAARQNKLVIKASRVASAPETAAH
jgi:hypothetical protein